MAYTLDEIRTNIHKDIAVNKAYAEAWKKVTYPTKKDGTPFANMSKNIAGAKYSPVSYAMQQGEYELTVFTQTFAAGYIHDSINVYELVRYLKDESMIAKTENYMPKQSYFEQVYRFDLEDIKKAVANRIEYLESYVADLEKQLAKLDTVYANFRNAFDAAIKSLQEDTKGFSHNDIYYAVKDPVINRYPYC
jgi:hypothetical protein